jgi:hypothetical protein
VHGADRVRVVVQHPDEPEFGRPRSHKLLGPLAAEASHERVLAIVDRVQVATDPDARLAVQPPIPARIGAFHEKDPRSIADEDVWNELLVRRIHLGGRSLQVATVCGHRASKGFESVLVGPANSAEVAATRNLLAGED